ncbi:DsbA family protein [Luteococcus peritonei]|uniref:DsbA family protein n=1 Tax=Luteococcus peritonei TaxID=88874 RepID=A0ABW4RSA1_9ACTN
MDAHQSPDQPPMAADPDAQPTGSTAAGHGSGGGPGSGWLHGESAPAPAARRPQRLPWVLVAMLTVLSLGLMGLLAQQSNELSRLRGQRAGQPASGSATPAASAQASQNPEAVAVMKKLPRRLADDPTAEGPANAPVVMIVWSDFRCPFCSVWARETYPKLKPYVASGSLRIEHRDLVLFGDQSMETAEAARAAGKQGRFWQFSDAVHAAAPTSGHPEITEKDLEGFARKAGVTDLARWRADRKASATRAAVQKDVDEARQLGLSGTPFFIINTTPLSGAQPLEVFTQTLEANGAHA